MVAPSVEAITTTDTTAAITTTTTGVASEGSARQKAEIPGSSFPAVAPAPVERGGNILVFYHTDLPLFRKKRQTSRNDGSDTR